MGDDAGRKRRITENPKKGEYNTMTATMTRDATEVMERST